MLWPLAFKAVRQQANKPRHAQPFAFPRTHELVKHDLRAIGEIAKLRFPHGQSIGFGQGIAVFKAQDRIFRQHGIDDFIARLARADVIEGIVPCLGHLVDKGGMALAKGAAGAILA